jgi:hypothetical protein
MILSAEKGADPEEAVVWYCDVDMATENEMDLGRTEWLDLAPPLSAPVPRKSSAGLRRRTLPDAAEGGGGGSRAEAYVLKTANFLYFPVKS